MRPISKLLTTTLLAITLGAPAIADTLELADGDLLEGDFVGSSNGIIMFNTGETIEAFPESEVVGIFLSEGVATMEKLSMQTVSDVLTIPAGTRMVIRTTDLIDSSRHGVGHRFRAQLEASLAVNGTTAVPRGTFVYGRISDAKQSGRLAGSSSMTIEFTELMIDDQLIPIVTGKIKGQASNEAGRTLGRTARNAALGGLIDGRSGARTGAKVGAGASLLTQGASINVPRGTLLETALAQPLVLR